MRNHLTLLSCLLALGQIVHASPQEDEMPGAPAPVMPSFAEGGLRPVRELLTQPLVDVDDSGQVWVRTRDMRVRMDEQGLSVLPIFGRESEQEWPVHFQLESVLRGERQLDVGTLGPVQVGDNRLELDHESVREVYHLGLDSVEQTFVFDALPGQGDLVVTVSVETELTPEVSGDQLRFVHDSLGEVTYGSASVIDAAGKRIAIERRWTGDGIELTVPQEFLSGAQLPVTIDPPVGTFTNTFGIADDGNPSIAWCGQSNEYLLCWQEFTSNANSDVYVTSFSSTGTQGGVFSVEIGSDYWADPSIAYAYGPDRALVAASVNADNGLLSSVRGRIIDVGAFATVGGHFGISTLGAPKRSIGVGGSSRDSLVNTYFCVSWSSEWTPISATVQYSIVDWDGTLVRTATDASIASGFNTSPSISASLGDTTLLGDYWTMVWITDADQDGAGTVWARRILWSGSPTLGGSIFLVDGTALNGNPSVTSRFDEALNFNGDRPSIVAYDRRISPGNRDTVVRVISDGWSGPLQNLSDEDGEDFARTLDQWGPVIATDGRGFFLAYHEEKWSAPGTAEWDVYQMAGNIVEHSGSANIALAERHQELASSTDPEFQLAIATVSDGELSTISDDAVCTWMQETSTAPGFGTIQGAFLDHPTSQGSANRAVGTQYCRAFPNSVQDFGGTTTGWLWISGTGSVLSTHIARTTDLPLNKFGFLIAAQSTGSVSFPAGGSGHLCLGGQIGRFGSQIATSGAFGAIHTVIDPQALPLGGALVSAIPGTAWYFQLWHRDNHPVTGASTSNFTNACAVHFTL